MSWCRGGSATAAQGSSSAGNATARFLTSTIGLMMRAPSRHKALFSMQAMRAGYRDCTALQRGVPPMRLARPGGFRYIGP
jgi:hypothetical protein